MNGGGLQGGVTGIGKEYKKVIAEESKVSKRVGKSFDLKARPATATKSNKYPVLNTRPISGKPPVGLQKENKKQELNYSKTTIKEKTEIRIIKDEIMGRQKTIHGLKITKGSTITRTRTEISKKTKQSIIERTKKYSDLAVKSDSYCNSQSITQTTKDNTIMVAFDTDFDLIEKEREVAALKFEEDHKEILQTRDVAVEALTSKPGFRAHFEKIRNMEFKVNEFVGLFVDDNYDKTLPLVVLQFDGVLGAAHSNTQIGIELMLSRKYCLSDFSQRKGCFVDSNTRGFLERMSRVGNVVLVFQKSNSRFNELSRFCQREFGGFIKGIFHKKVNNKNSKFINYDRILSCFDLDFQEVFVVSPVHTDINYWLESRELEKSHGLSATKLLKMSEWQDFDTVIPLVTPSSSYRYYLGFVESFLLRESETVKFHCNSSENEFGHFLVVSPKSLDVLDKIETFVMSRGQISSMGLAPFDYQDYLKTFEEITYRNYLKTIRKSEDDACGLTVQVQMQTTYQPATYQYHYHQHSQLFMSNILKMQNLPSVSSMPIYTHQSFINILQEHTHAVNKKNQELQSIVCLAKSMSLI